MMTETNFDVYRDEIVAACTAMSAALKKGGEDKDVLLKVLKCKKQIGQACTDLEAALNDHYTEVLVTEVKKNMTKTDKALKRSLKSKQSTAGKELNEVFYLIENGRDALVKARSTIEDGYNEFSKTFPIAKGSGLYSIFGDDDNVDMSEVIKLVSSSRPYGPTDRKRLQLTAADFGFLVFLYVRNRLQKRANNG
jgi:hypothetical protein